MPPNPEATLDNHHSFLDFLPLPLYPKDPRRHRRSETPAQSLIKTVEYNISKQRETGEMP